MSSTNHSDRDRDRSYSFSRSNGHSSDSTSKNRPERRDFDRDLSRVHDSRSEKLNFPRENDKERDRERNHYDTDSKHRERDRSSKHEPSRYDDYNSSSRRSHYNDDSNTRDDRALKKNDIRHKNELIKTEPIDNHRPSHSSSSSRHHNEQYKIFATIPIDIFGYSNVDNPFHTEILDKPFVWSRRDRYREKLGHTIPQLTPQYLREQALRMSENVLAVKERRLHFQIQSDANKRLTERTQRDIEFMRSHDFELEQSKNSLLQLYKQAEIRTISNSESPFHIFIKYVLYRLKLEKLDVLKQIGIATADSKYERDRHNHFIYTLLEVHNFLDINDVIDSLSFDESIHVYAGITRMIELTEKTLKFQAKQEQKIQQQKQQQQQQPSTTSTTSSASIGLVKTAIDYLPIVCEGDLQYWNTLQHVLGRETEIKYFEKMGFTSTHAYHIVMSTNPEAHLTFHKLSSQYKRYLNDKVTKMMSQSEAIQKTGKTPLENDGLSVAAQAMITTIIKQSKPIYSGLDGLQKINHYVDPMTIGQNSTSNNDHQSDRDNVRLREQMRIQELTDQCVPLEWYISTGSGINVDREMLDSVYKKVHENLLSFSDIKQLQSELQDISDDYDQKDAAIRKGILHELEFAESRTKLHIFYRRLAIIRAQQLQKVADIHHNNDILHHQQLLQLESEKEQKLLKNTTTSSTNLSSSISIPLAVDEIEKGQKTAEVPSLPEDKLSHEDEIEFHKRAQGDSNEVSIQTIDLSKYITSDSASNQGYSKLITRRPKFISKVKTGFHWTKYNRSHYSGSNPPPRAVQGYRFEIFYPELINSAKYKPKYSIINDSADPDYCILKFSAGPPYEDIAFKIVRKDWSTQSTSGFRSSFARGILTLAFNFRSVGYRR